MYLERISIYGFKTFRKETEILLSPKITCIVGPNGSGKSNIVDGIRWALGEQRLSLLRAAESTDLIFSGSAFKKPLSVASVKLVFNNEDRTFPNVNTPRVVVERRIYRSKESGYFVNNNSMRLQDVMGLFYSAGMYNHMYSIVSQGRIEEILLAKPEQKRALIEQVAGVEVFKKKRREALKKLNETEQNLLRVKDNLSELKKRVDRIASESKKAHMYYFLNDRLKQLESTLLNYLLSSLNRQIETLKSGIMDIENEEKILLEKIRSKKEELEKLEKKQENLLKEFEKMRNKKEAMLIEEAKLKEREVFLEDKKNKAEEQIKENNLSIEKNRRKAGYINNDIENLKKNEEETNKEIVERQQGIEKLKAEIEEIEREIIPLLEEEKKSKEDCSILQEKRLKKERILSSIKSEINYLQKEKSRIEFIVKNAENLEIENIAELQNQIFSISNLISEKQREKESISEETALIKYKISEIKNFISAHSVKGRGFRNGTLGSTLNNVEIKNGIEEELNAFILKNREQLSSKKDGHFFIENEITPLKSISENGIKPITNSINSPFLQGIYIADNIEAATDFFKNNTEKIFIKKIITKDGFIMLSPFEVKINSNLLIEEKSRELKKLLEDKNLKESKQTNLIKDIYELNNKIKALQNTLQTAKRKEEEKNKALIQKGRIAEIEKEMVKKKTAAQNIESEIKLLVSQIDSLSEKGILSEKRKKLDELKNSLHRETMLLKDIQYKADTIGNDIKHAEIRLKSTNRNTESLIEENKNLEINLKIAKQDLFQSERAYNKLKLDIAELQSIEKEIKEKTMDIEKEIKRINLEISRMEEQKENILKKIEKQHIAMAEKNTQINNIKERMREKGIKEREILYEIDEKKIKIEISSVKAKIQSLGAIDFTSVEEEEQVKEEFEKKESIYKDVLSSKKELESFIKEMEKRTHEEFENTLQGVEKYFSVFFRRMFKGGNANIERTMDEKKEVKGIELSVRLPGKKKQSLPLLSGGEKSLTTLAFLFAIFKVRPAPFYVLDEVDAALDEENVIKFGELLGEEADFAQFIVITHNKETMQKADMLYGITMEEDGISKVVSLKLV